MKFSISFIFSLLFGLSVLNAWEIPSIEKVKDPSSEIEIARSRSYQLEKDFQIRAKKILQGLASVSLDRWRKGYFTGGDPGKYLPLHAMAKLMVNPSDPEPKIYMNDNRSYKEHYHFAAVNWARFIPIFSSILTDETRKKFENEAAKYVAYLNPKGTENHKVMWWTTSNVLPYYIISDTFGGKNKEEALKIAKEILRRYVKGLYEVGQGEWDSSTYLVFDINGMLNIYDFSKDEECRLLAKAALDWYCATYALKYRNGIFCGPNQRGHASYPMESLTDQTGYLWWGIDGKNVEQHADDFRYTVHSITSSYRPNKIITNIAIKNLSPLHAEQFNTKPNYWHGQGIPPKAGQYFESFYLSKYYSMGSLWNGHGSQITRFQIVVSVPDGAVSITGGSPRKSDHNGVKTDFGYLDGIGRYDQSIQSGPVYICISKIPDDEKLAYSFVSIPEKYFPEKHNDWFIYEIDKVFVCVYPLGGVAEISKTDLSEKQLKENEEAISKGKEPRHNTSPIIKINGRNVGFIVQMADKERFPSIENLKTELDKTKVLIGKPFNGEVKYVDLDGREIRMKFNPVEGSDNQTLNMAECKVNGMLIEPQKWNVYSGPFIQQKDGIVKVSDGNESFTIDFSGDKPVYKK